MNTFWNFVTLLAALLAADYLYTRIPLKYRNSRFLQLTAGVLFAVLAKVYPLFPGVFVSPVNLITSAIGSFVILMLIKCVLGGPIRFIKWLLCSWLIVILVDAAATKFGWWHNLGSVKYVIVLLILLYEANLIYKKVVFLRIYGALGAFGRSAYLAPMDEYAKRTFTPEQYALIKKDERTWEAKRKAKKLLQLFAETLLTFSIGGTAIWLVLNLF